MKTSSFPCSLWVALFAVCFSSLCQSIDAQTLEDLLGKAKEDIEKAQQSGVSLGTVSIISNSSYIDSSGFHIDGEVYNSMALNTAKEVQVNATFYDTNGKVVGSIGAATNPEDLPPEENATFNILLTSASIPITDIDHYDLVVDWK